MTTTPEREYELQAFLRQRAEKVDVPGDFAPLAIATRRRTMRNRAVLGAVAAVAVVAVATPAVWSRQGPGPSPAPAITTPTSSSGTSTVPTETAPTTPPTRSATVTSGPPATSTSPPASQPAAAPTQDSNASPMNTQELGFGPQDGSPEAAYAVGDVLYFRGAERRLPVASGIQYLAMLAQDGVLVHAPAEGRTRPTYVIDSNDAIVLRLSDVQDIKASGDGSRFTTVDGTGRIRLRDARGAVLASLAVGDPNVTVRGFFGDAVYFVVVDGSGHSKTRAWDPASGSTRDVTSGSFVDISELKGLAILWPEQDYDPGHTCYGMFDLAAGRVNWWSCGSFAPTHFGAGGNIVVGPEVADGAGTTGFKSARTDDGRIEGRVTLTRGAWSPSWTADDAKGLTFTLLDREAPTRQALAACSFPTACSIDSLPASVTAAQRDSYDWPIVLADN
ncbi:hypothetical protein ACWEOW_01470 [Monashia sp. NPDC004114]